MSSAKLRVALVGAGGIATASHIPAYQALSDQCEIVGIADVDFETAKRVADKFGIPKAFASHEELYANCELDAVTVTTPNRFHLEPTLHALEKGIHVLCEKPLGMDGAQAAEMVLAARKAKRILQVGLQLRFSGPVSFAKKYCESGKMGEIYYAKAHAMRRRGVPSWGVFIDRDKQGGGPLIDIGVHILDLTLYLMGNPTPVSVSARTWDHLGKNPNLYNSFGEYDRTKFTVEDFATGFIRLEGGKVISLESSFMANQAEDLYQSQLFGTDSGLLLKPFDAANGVEIYTESDKQQFNLKPTNIPKVENAQIPAVQSFLNAVKGDSACVTPGEHGHVLNAIFDAMYKSSETEHEEPVMLQAL